MKLNLIFIISLFSCYCVFAWSAVSFFEIKKTSYSKLFSALKLFTILFWATSLFLLYKNPQLNFAACILGSLVNVFCLQLFIWSSRSIKNMKFSAIYGKDVPEQVYTKGPYRFIRNPFYASYLLCYLTTLLILGSVLLLILFLILLTLYLVAIKIEENKFIYSPDFKNYSEYKKKTGALIPKVFNYKSDIENTSSEKSLDSSAE